MDAALLAVGAGGVVSLFGCSVTRWGRVLSMFVLDALWLLAMDVVDNGGDFIGARKLDEVDVAGWPPIKSFSKEDLEEALEEDFDDLSIFLDKENSEE